MQNQNSLIFLLFMLLMLTPCCTSMAQKKTYKKTTVQRRNLANANAKKANKGNILGKYSVVAVSDTTITVKGISFVMKGVQGGNFRMGLTREQEKVPYNNSDVTVHRVAVSSFRIGQTEVTQELWEAVMGEPTYYHKDENNNHPIECMTWNQCQKFISKLNEETGLEFRLPTEAEWEYAARGGNKSHGYRYSGSDYYKDVAWTPETSESHSHEVAQKKPNELGIYDMSGNVWEWCQDYFGRYGASPKTNPLGPSYGSEGHVLRGGSWMSNDELSQVSVRGKGYSDTSYSQDYGLRLALPLKH